MIVIEIPTWLAIIVLIFIIMIMLYFIIGDFFIRWLHKHYELILKEKEERKK